MRRLPVLLAALAIAACEQETQQLPFTTEAATTRTVPAGGGTVTSAAGAAVQIPAGSVGAGTSVTITPGSVPAAVRQSGTPASNGFALETLATLVIPKSGAGGLVTVTRTFQIDNARGQLESASVSMTFPVHLFQ